MPIPPSHVQPCYVCGRRGERPLVCGQCQVMPYCSRECQLIDWNRRGHRERCLPLLERTKERVAMDKRFFQQVLKSGAIDDALCQTFEKKQLGEADAIWAHAQRVVAAQVASGGLPTVVGDLVQEARALHDEQAVRMLETAKLMADPTRHTDAANLEASVLDAYHSVRMEETIRQIGIHVGESEWTEAERTMLDAISSNGNGLLEIDPMGYLDRHVMSEAAKTQMLLDEQEIPSAAVPAAQTPSSDSPSNVTVPELEPSSLNADFTARQRRRQSLRAVRDVPVVAAVKDHWSWKVKNKLDMIAESAGSWVKPIWRIIRQFILQLPILDEWLEYWCALIFPADVNRLLVPENRTASEENRQQTRRANYKILRENFPTLNAVMSIIVLTLQDIALFWIGAALTMFFESLQDTTGATNWVPEPETAWTSRVREMADGVRSHAGNHTAYITVSNEITKAAEARKAITTEMLTAQNSALTALQVSCSRLNEMYGLNLTVNDTIEIPATVNDTQSLIEGIAQAFEQGQNVKNGHNWATATLQLFRTKFAPRRGSAIFHVTMATMLVAGFFYYNINATSAGVAAAGLVTTELLNLGDWTFWRAWFAYRVRQAAVEEVSALGNWIFGITVGGSVGEPLMGQNVPITHAETMAVIWNRQALNGGASTEQLDAAEDLQVARTIAANSDQIQAMQRTGPLRHVMNLVLLAGAAYVVYRGVMQVTDFFIYNPHISFDTIMTTSTDTRNLTQGYLASWITMATGMALHWHSAGIFMNIGMNLSVQALLTGPLGSTIADIETRLGYNFLTVLGKLALVVAAPILLKWIYDKYDSGGRRVVRRRRLINAASERKRRLTGTKTNDDEYEEEIEEITTQGGMGSAVRTYMRYGYSGIRGLIILWMLFTYASRIFM